MGKGDIKTKKGKISAGTFGALRPRKRKKKKAVVVEKATQKAKKTVAKKPEVKEKEGNKKE